MGHGPLQGPSEIGVDSHQEMLLPAHTSCYHLPLIVITNQDVYVCTESTGWGHDNVGQIKVRYWKFLCDAVRNCLVIGANFIYPECLNAVLLSDPALVVLLLSQILTRLCESFVM